MVFFTNCYQGTKHKFNFFRERILLRFSRYRGYVIKDPRWLLMFLLGRFNITRYVAKFVSRPPSQTKYIEKDSIFNNIDVDKVVKSLENHGYFLNINLPQEILTEITNFAFSAKIYVRNCFDVNFVYSQRKEVNARVAQPFVHGSYPFASSKVKAIDKIKNDPKLLKIAANYLGAEPINVRTELFWCFIADRAVYEKLGIAQTMFHYDLDDYRVVKFFFYITDVDRFSGPHVCVRGSHTKKKLSHQLSLLIGRSDQEIIDYYGSEDIITICGKAGFGFAEDPFCFHRGTPPVQKDRLMLQVEFATNDYGLWKS